MITYDIFISYSRRDQAKVEAIAQTLESLGWSVWWDPNLKAGERFGEKIRQLVRSAKVVLVCWSEASVASDWVKKEAGWATPGTLVPVSLDAVVPPSPFHELHTPNLRNMLGGTKRRELRRLIGVFDELAPIQDGKSTAGDIFQTRQTRAAIGLISWLFALYYSVATYLNTQIPDGAIPGTLEPDRVKGSLIALGLVALATCLSGWSITAYAGSLPDEDWTNRLPRWTLLRRDRLDHVARFQAGALLVSLWLPVGALVHFATIITSDGEVVVCDSGQPIWVGFWAWPERIFGHYYCFGNGTLDAAQDGLTFVPTFEPIVLIIAVGFACILTILATFRVVGIGMRTRQEGLV